MVLTQGVFPLKGVVQHYAWGGYNFIPSLLGIENKEGKPYAEYWLGAHPNHPSVIKNTNLDLAQIIQNDPASILGRSIEARFPSLPYLFKVLDVRQMLSIQVHPDKASAEKGFEEENKKGIPLHAPNRNYKDDNHKPELMAALSDFWLLHGFKEESNLEMILDAVPEFGFLKSIFESGGYKALYEEVMLMEQARANELLQPLVQRIVPLYEAGELQKDDEDFWAARAAVDFCRDGNYDRGIFSIYFFNLVHLKKGEGIFQPAGMPHAYLEGQNVELMANSDNVLRAGLTDKYIDVHELMKHVRFVATLPHILSGGSHHHKVYPSPAEEFELHQIELKEGEEEIIHTVAPQIMLLMEGVLVIHTAEEKFEMRKGDAVLVSEGIKLRLKAETETNLFCATVPVE